MLLKRRLVKYIDEFLDDNPELSADDIKHLDEYGIHTKTIIEKFGVRENIERRKMIKLIGDCRDEGYIRIGFGIKVTNEGRMFIKRYVFFGKVLEQMNISAVYVLFLTAGIVIGFIITYIIIPFIKLLK